MKYHPMGDDTVPASASSDQDSVLKWSTCIFLLRVGELGKFGEGDRIREGNLSNRKWEIQRNGEVYPDPFHR